MKKQNLPPTMKDVAKEAGVSLGTVSNVFNGQAVGESYRLKVEEAARRLGYRLNGSARALKTNRTYSIALLIPSIKHPFFASLSDEITDCLMQRGYRNNLMITNFDPDAEQKSIELIMQHKIDGIIGLTYHPDLVIEEGLPFVSIDRHFSAGVPCVSSDNFGGGQMAAEKLIELGCRNLLFFRIGSDIYGEVNKRESGFESICRSRNIKYNSIVLNNSETEAPFYEYLRSGIHDGIPEYDGIFCNSDQLAVHVVSFLRSEGLRVPEDVQVIGYDGIRSFYTDKVICSTIVQPIRQMAEAAVDIILNKDGAAAPALVSLPVRYEPGGTTKDSLPG